ncbi:hypothetical protein VTN77DRAFT_8471 [Rasamsonia byssochlamydoides]|uniref:uncharacterized protein n=1 Tax=Rasamsonia byssochlamydoides TaxID=89139 RepID=UPI0037447F23
MELTDVKPSEITFKQELFSSTFSVIFLVVIRDQTSVMKVHHGRGPRQYYEPKDRELDIHVLESTAYRRFKEHGLCDRGIVPQFYGTIENAILFEYIPNLEMIHLHNYTRKRMDKFIEGIQQIHKAFVRHKDAKPRNMLVVEDDPERVVWIDFDRAETYDPDQITYRQRVLMQEEEEIVTSFKDCLEADCAKGKLDEAIITSSTTIRSLRHF